MNLLVKSNHKDFESNFFLHITVSRAMQKSVLKASKSIAPLSILNHMQMYYYCIMHFLQINSNSSSGYLCEFLDKSNEHLYAFAKLWPLIVTIRKHIPCSLRRLKFKLHFHKIEKNFKQTKWKQSENDVNCCSFSGHSQNKIGSPMNFVLACGTWLDPETQTIIYPSLSLDSIDISFPRFVGIVYQIKFSVFLLLFRHFAVF